MDILDVAFLIKSIPQLILEGVPVALIIVIVSTVTGFILGLAFTAVLVAKSRRHAKLLLIFKRIVTVFTGAVRGIPPVLLLFLIYFGVPQIAKGMGFIIDTTKVSNKFILVIVATALSVSSNASEMFRSAYNAVDVCQIEAAKSFGYNVFQRFIHVILPQGLVIILPNIGNMLNQEIQNSSLIYYVGVVDIMGKAKQINANVYNSKSIELYIAAAIIYWLMCFLVSKGIKWSEKKMSVGLTEIKSEVQMG
jgi:ABC-type amino acid transport system permease subunit